MGKKIRRKFRTPCGDQQRTGVAYKCYCGYHSVWCIVQLLEMRLQTLLTRNNLKNVHKISEVIAICAPQYKTTISFSNTDNDITSSSQTRRKNRVGTQSKLPPGTPPGTNEVPKTMKSLINKLIPGKKSTYHAIDELYKSWADLNVLKKLKKKVGGKIYSFLVNWLYHWQ